MRKRHIDYFTAINQLLNAIYFYTQDDYEALLIVLKDGALTGEKHSDEDIADLKATKYFWQRYVKYLHKKFSIQRSHATIQNNGSSDSNAVQAKVPLRHSGVLIQ